MRALFAAGVPVPITRVIGDYRRWLLPIGAVLAINVGVLALVVAPMARLAASSESRAQAALQAGDGAATELATAERTRDGQSEATTDLDKFYREVLPADVTAARRVMQLKLSQLARQHDVTFERSAFSAETLKESSLERLKVTYGLAGGYTDIRQFIYEVETAAEFIVIDNMVLSEGSDDQSPLLLTLDLSTYYKAAGDGR